MFEGKISTGVLLIVMAGVNSAAARGVSPYLPLSISPVVERQVERVLLLAGQPVMRRPIAAAAVLDALPAACEVDQALCAAVRNYLQHYMSDAGIPLAQVQGNVAFGDTDQTESNAHGRSRDSAWQLAASAYYQPFDHLLLNAGAIAYQGEAVPTGTYLSAGFDLAQLDVGYRDHWFSPMTDSSMLISTEAPTMPSITLSSSRPISRLGLSYEVFLAQMSSQKDIQYFSATTSGRPKLAGLQLSAAPVTGYTVSLNRLMQYGGGARKAGISEFLDALTVNSNRSDVAGTSQEFGNQVASLASTMVFPGKVPFAIKLEYAGEDNSYAGNYRLGDTALLVGVDLPSLGRFDANYEFSEWQNVWYTHHIYPQGLTNRGKVIGHWFGDQRADGDRTAGSSNYFRLGMRTDSGAYWQADFRSASFHHSLDLSPAYDRLKQLSLAYSTAWQNKSLEARVYVGRGATEGSYGGVSASISLEGLSYQSQSISSAGATRESAVEFFVDAGVNNSHMRDILRPDEQFNWTDDAVGAHVGLGFRRPVAEHSDLGVRVELDGVHGRKIVSLRAIDYRYRIGRRLAISGFFGVARMEEGAVALGYYMGGGMQWLHAVKGWDLSLDMRVHDKLSRNRILASDPPDTSGVMPRMHTDISGFSLYASRSF